MEQAGPAMESLIKKMAASTSDGHVDASLSPATGVGVDPVDCLISLVKKETRDVDPGEYSPDKVHIGPYYYRCRSSDECAKEKEELLHGFLRRDGREGEDKIRSCLMAMAERVDAVDGRARQYYDNTFSKITKDEFTCMLLLDGFYLLSRFVPVMGSSVPDEDIDVVRDVVFLLQNQIPFFVLEEIHKLITGGAEDDESFVLRGAAGHVEKLVRRHGYSVATLRWDLNPAPRRPCHLLHLLYMYFRPAALDDGPATQTSSAAPTPTTARDEIQVTVNDDNHRSIDGNGAPAALDDGPATQTSSAAPTPTPARDEIQLTVNDNHRSINGNGAINGSTSGARAREDDMPTPVPPARWRAATYYHVAGVRLVRRNLDGEKARSVLDVELAGGTLHVPRLTVDSNTLTILRNMVALEQNSPRLGSHVTAYCFFMSQMASTKEDVELLVSKGIIVHFLGSAADVAAGFAKLCNGLHIYVGDPGFCRYLRAEQEALERLPWAGWRKAMAWLRHTKCSNPLMVLAVVAAVVVFVCALVEALFAVLSYAKGKKS